LKLVAVKTHLKLECCHKLQNP